jgi:two-component system, cell cycle sensor histidine kinase and response regulator CckA
MTAMGRPLRIIVVEDTPDDAEMIVLALQRGGHDLAWERVETAAQLSAALEKGSWDAVLSDYTLPRFGAASALKLVRAADLDLPFLVVSGTVGEEAAVGTMLAGANDYVLKHNLTRLAPALDREVREAENRRARRAGERAASHLAALVESSDDAIISKNLENKVTSWNPAAERLYGWTATEVIGREIFFLVPSDKSDELDEILRRLRAGKQAEHFETVRMHRNGLRLDVSLTMSPIRGADGRLVGVSTTARDIRERKRAEESLRSSETRYRRLFEAAQDGVLIVDPVSRQILDANPFLTDLLGYRREELVGKELWEIGLFQDIASNKEAFRSLQEVGYIRYENQPLKTKDGRHIEVEFVSNTYDVGAALVIQCNIRDITERKRAQDSVRASEERYRTLVVATASIVWNTPASGEFESEQPSWTAFTEQTFEELRGWGWLNAVHPDDRENTARAWDSSRTGRSVCQFEQRLRRADGEYRRMSVRVVPIPDSNGRIREWVGVHTDVTNQKCVEVERDESLARLQLHIERMPLAYILFDTDYFITDWNPAAERIFGYTKAEALGMGPFDLAPPSFRLEATDILVRIRSGDMTAHSVNENLTKDGRTIVCEWFNTPLTEGGHFVGVLCLALDVTARREAESALRLRDRAIQAVAQGILITDPCQHDNPIIYASPGFLRLTGFAAEEVIGRNCRFLQGKDTDPSAIARIRDAVQVEQPCTVELLNYRRDGTAFWNELSISPVRDSVGRLTHFVGVQTDVTGRRSLEEQFRQSQKMDAFGQLAGGVAHDFNNLLTVINGYSEMLIGQLPASSPSRQPLVEIQKAGQRSAGLTRQLLAFSRQQVLAPRVLDLNEVVADTEKMLNRLIGEDVQLATTLDPELWAVRADPGQIEQVLMNLAVNARDAMPRGGQLTIETKNVNLDEAYVQAQSDSRAGPHVLLSVTDTGKGMPADVKAKIFEPFFTTKAPGKGTGLGLATVYGIVKQSGGHIAVSSEVDVGTTFKVYLARSEPATEETKSRQAVRSSPQGTETILVAEDEDGVRGLTRLILVECGYTVLAAANGAEAIRLAARHDGPIHMLITDVVMPGAGGRSVAEELAKQRQGVKVLFVSGYTDDAVLRHGVLREGVNFLQKPYSPAFLAVKVRELLDATTDPAAVSATELAASLVQPSPTVAASRTDGQNKSPARS